MNSVKSNSLSLKYQRLTPPGCKDKKIRKYTDLQLVSIDQKCKVDFKKDKKI